ncbi:MAG: hypothetical protein HYZ08_01350 [Candidatus Kerfeldbacteria bacterium]|nr:hypothetical protein [Candidatus Kerfeldbacteria bacterium]
MSHLHREAILQQHQLRVVQEFDTWQHSEEKKDVVLAKNVQGDHVILRIGETRDPAIFASGFVGTTLVIPQLLYHGQFEDVDYEIEEYIEGTLVCDLDADPLELLLKTFWEFQEVAVSQPLKNKNDLEKQQRFLNTARPLLERPDDVNCIFQKHHEFWNGEFPSKWKFARDNLILTPDHHIALIDNANMGLRWFGYDLGWLIWPRWVEMQTYDVEKEWTYLEGVLACWRSPRPETLDIPKDLAQAFWLNIFARIVGAAYDVANNTSHLVRHDLGSSGEPQRTAAHVAFLNALLERTIQVVG